MLKEGRTRMRYGLNIAKHRKSSEEQALAAHLAVLPCPLFPCPCSPQDKACLRPKTKLRH